MESKQLQPSFQLPVVNIKEVNEITHKSSFEEVLEADADRSENILRLLDSGWSEVKSISSMCKLAIATMTTIERRRKLLCMPYGAEPKSPKTVTVLPLD